MEEPSSYPVLAPQADEASERRHQERRNEDRRKLERTSVRSLLALLLAAAAVLVGAMAMWLHFDEGRRLANVRTGQDEIQAQLSTLRQQVTASDSRTDAQARELERLEGLAPRLAQLADSITELRGRLDAGRRAWTLAEARYLMEVANRHLLLERDATSAIVALDAADARLKELRNPALAGVRGMLAKEIQALHVMPQPDLTGIAARLAGAEELAGQLPVMGAIPQRFRPESTEDSSAPGFGRAWQLIRSSLTNMISIRRVGRDTVELVSLEEQSVRRQHLQLLVFAARLAAVRSDNAMFHKNIDGARQWLAEMFDPRHPGVANVNETLRELAGVDITPPLPDISGSLRMLDRVAFAGTDAS